MPKKPEIKYAVLCRISLFDSWDETFLSQPGRSSNRKESQKVKVELTRRRRRLAKNSKFPQYQVFKISECHARKDGLFSFSKQD